MLCMLHINIVNIKVAYYISMHMPIIQHFHQLYIISFFRGLAQGQNDFPLFSPSYLPRANEKEEVVICQPKTHPEGMLRLEYKENSKTYYTYYSWLKPYLVRNKNHISL